MLKLSKKDTSEIVLDRKSRVVKNTKPLLIIHGRLGTDNESSKSLGLIFPSPWPNQAPEYDYICQSKKEEMKQLVFYFPHPSDRNTFIQCDTEGKAYLRFCMDGKIFTENLECENEI